MIETFGPCTLIQGDCTQALSQIPGGSVSLVATSPPYNCGKDYGTFADRMSWEEYWKFTSEWIDEVVRVLVPGGRLAVNLPWWMGKKPRRDVPYQFKTVARDCGLTFIDKIMWIKGDSDNVHTSGGFGGGGCGWGTYMSPSGPSIRCASEPILIFSNGGRGRGAVSGEGKGMCVRGDMTVEEWMEWTIDVWFIRSAGSPTHPAVFPQEIPTRLVKLYTFPGETVLDPFAGEGTTGLAAIATGRTFVGCEVDPTHFSRAVRKCRRSWLNKRSELPLEKPVVYMQGKLL